ncbi:formimidoylglutamate deiminase [Subtercola frigoramans]
MRGAIRENVRITAAADGTISAVDTDTPCAAGDVVLGGVVYPGAVNAHSHAFHRLLRGRTHADGGSFWTWRELMYKEADALEPDRYEAIATAVYGEMVAAGWTSVAEFHYVHHRTDGSPYGHPHAFEQALARAATTAGIRLTLLDTCYLAGGFGQPLSPGQRRFGDGTVRAWLDRHRSLGASLSDEFDDRFVSVGAAVHSVRAVPVEALEILAGELDPRLPLHIHLSEQPAENDACREATGRTPTELLHDVGLLRPTLSAVHATHLTPNDVGLLGEAGGTVVMCPTTEADLGDGIGPARALRDAGVRIALGTDQHAVIDPFLEARGLEYGERLASGQRGRFSPQELLAAMGSGGSASVGRPVGLIEPGQPCDFIEVDPGSARTSGSELGQIVMTGTAADVMSVVIGAERVARRGVHETLGDIGAFFESARGRR